MGATSWDKRLEDEVLREFHRGIAAHSEGDFRLSYLRLQGLGLSIEQIENGFLAAAMQLTVDGAVTGDLDKHLENVQRTQPDLYSFLLRFVRIDRNS